VHIRSLQVRAYRSLASIKFKPPRLAALTGATGSGKSAVLECVRLAMDLVTVKDVTRAAVGWPPSLTTSHAPRDETPSMIVETGRARAVAVPDESTPNQWRVRFPARSQAVTNVPVRQFAPDDYVAPIYSFNGNALKQPCLLQEPGQRLGHDGAGLAPVLARLLGRHRDRFDRVEARLRARLRWIKRMYVLPVRLPGPESRVGQGLTFDTLGGDQIPAPLMSEGVLRFLALLTLLEEDRPSYLLLEEPETGLDPVLQAALIQVIRDTLRNRPDLAVLMTTHSQVILDGLAPEEVYLTRLDDAGYTQLRRMADLKDPRVWTSTGPSARTSPQAQKGQ